jgi:hypothetical protein
MKILEMIFFGAFLLQPLKQKGILKMMGKEILFGMNLLEKKMP